MFKKGKKWVCVLLAGLCITDEVTLTDYLLEGIVTGALEESRATFYMKDGSLDYFDAEKL